MLGEQLGEVSGVVSGFRIVPGPMGPRVETNFEGKGTFAGENVTEIVTYWASARMDGTFYGGADGIVVTEETQTAAYTGNGVGRMKGNNLAAEWRGALYYTSFAPVFARLTVTAVLFEFEIEPDGKSMTIKTYAWE